MNDTGRSLGGQANGAPFRLLRRAGEACCARGRPFCRKEEGGAKTPGTSAGVSGRLALQGVKNVHIAYTNTKQGGGETGGSGSETGGTSAPAQQPNPTTGA